MKESYEIGNILIDYKHNEAAKDKLINLIVSLLINKFIHSEGNIEND